MDELLHAFGERVFSDDVMRAQLPKDIYRQLRATIDEGRALSGDVAEAVATAMRTWAVSLGATHYTHWFQPMTGQTAEKHEAFLSPAYGGGAILEFSGKHLIRGESDASAFPSGGLRTAFEARGYTAWDCTSPAFVKEEKDGIVALCIPTAFCSFNGEALDKKTPLLRSMEAISKQAGRVLGALGLEAQRVLPYVGAEQEYFLVDRDAYFKRRDLLFAGRTLFGAPPPKGQELSDQYYATIRPRVSAFMKEVNRELWRLGVPAKTQHNEAAPAMHELAVVYASANIACDHNQLVMEVLKTVANRHNLQCLLHEKPFNGLAGAGKHNNWSLMTADGKNLFSASKRPFGDLAFRLLLTAVIAAADKHAGLLCASCASAGNDSRLGEHEAPPAVLSMFIGEDMMELLGAAENGGSGADEAPRRADMHLGVGSIPALRKDFMDRNRTAPFAFTGDKFELRMPGASMSVADSTTVLNVIVADELRLMADELERAQAGKAREARAAGLCAELVRAHRRVLFGGNCYTQDWLMEAGRRGLTMLASAYDSIGLLGERATIDLYGLHGVLSAAELNAREHIMYDTYAKTIHIEALALINIARTQLLPAAVRYASMLAESVARLSAVGVSGLAQMEILEAVQSYTEALYAALGDLERAAAAGDEDVAARAMRCRDAVLPAMRRVRAELDALESVVDSEVWPVPTYAELLYYK